MTSRLAAVVGGSSGVSSIGHRSSSSPPLHRQRLAVPSSPRRQRLLEHSPSATTKGFGSGGAKKKTVKGTTTTPTPPWLADSSVCPCCSGRKFNTCCAPFLSGDALPQTAEQLMRSRFAAYVRKNADYILKTTHPDNRSAAGGGGSSTTAAEGREDGSTTAPSPSTLVDDIRATIKRVSWQRLKVEGTEAGGRDDDEGFVTFSAWFKVTGQVGQKQDGGDAVGTMCERSRFVRRRRVSDEDDNGGEARGEWSYLEGTPVINGVPRVLS